jgi:glutathione S-transferase
MRHALVIFMPPLTLVVANKNYASWSFRPWLALRQAGLPFEEVVIFLDQPDTREKIARYSPSGRVPVLRDGELAVWDSLAIIEYVAEKAPRAGLWPEDPGARAVARAVSAEMHSGFAALRKDLPMMFRGRFPAKPLDADVSQDIARIVALWGDCRERFGQGGPFLFGAFSTADCMYAPVVSRFLTYAVPLPPAAQDYVEAISSLPAWRAWATAAETEPLRPSVNVSI